MGNDVTRRNKLRKAVQGAKADALLVTNFLNVTYLTGFTGDDSYLLITPDGETLITDRRYTTQLEDECPDLKLFVREPGEQILAAVVKVIEKARIERLGVEAASMTVGFHESFCKEVPGVQTISTDGLVEGLRLIKDRGEIEETRRACRLAERAFEVVRALITPEMSERDVAAELEYQARRFGAKGLSFPPIIAVGPRAALPHATPTDRKIGSDDFTLIDWGAYTGLYMSDLTRVLVTGKISPKFRKIYDVVLKAQLAAIDAIRPGRTCEQVDRVARRIISKAGFGSEFGHGLGHGLGLEIHEAPRLAENQTRELRPGMIVTVEPGIYLPEWGGVRIEDDVLVTRTGHEVLSNVPKQLEECVLA
jgi:Xaa-Pro aminopeptidase